MTQLQDEVAYSQIRANEALADYFEDADNIEQRRYELAKAAITGAAIGEYSIDYIADEAVKIANAVIKKLKDYDEKAKFNRVP